VKDVVGKALGLGFAHSLGLIHGHLTANNIFFDSDHRVQIADFGMIGLEVGEGTARWGIAGILGEGWTPEVDIRAFVSLLQYPATLPDSGSSEKIVRSRAPGFVFDIIDVSLTDCTSRCSLNYILSILKANNFEIIDGVDSRMFYRLLVGLINLRNNLNDCLIEK
jgi:serine/threonine protein kinase